MATRTLSQIVNELNKADTGTIKSLQRQQAAIPGQIASEEAGLQAKQTQAFDSILGGARQRGLGFSGIPLGEQAKYTSTEFLPALARLKQQGMERQTSLGDAILNIRSGNSKMGQQLYQGELDRAEQIRQFNASLNEQRAARAAASRASAGSSFAPTLGGGRAPAAPKMVRKKDGGFAFTDPYGNSISAAAYSLGTGTPFRQLLQSMADKGDKGARTALGFVGDDYNFDSGRIGKNQGLFNALTWGVR